MRFARFVSAHDCHNIKVDRLVETVELDVLQLDYRWPATVAESDGSRNGHAAGFLRQLGALHKSLFLDPDLKLITNAGGGDTTACVESVAEYLCQHGNAELLLTGVRGDNLLDRLEELIVEGIELRDVDSGMTLHELTRPLLNAHVELGAGPIKTALDEGSRFVVTGCYDSAAPLIGAAVHAGKRGWADYDVLAQLAVASEVDEALLELDDANELSFSTTAGGEESEIEVVAAGGRASCADVRCEFVGEMSDLQAPLSEQLKLLRGAEPTGHWLLKIDYVASYTATAVWKLPEPARMALEEQLVEQITASVGDGLAVEVNSGVGAREKGQPLPTGWMQISGRSAEKRPCEAFVTEVKNWLARNQQRMRIRIEVAPSLQCDVQQFVCEVPRDSVAVSVDTRPAKEWR